MSRIAAFPDLAQAREDAALWIARLDRGLTPGERAEFTEWSRNPANARALRQLSGTWEELDALSLLADELPESERPAAAAADASRGGGWWQRALVATAVLGVLATVGAVWRTSFTPADAPALLAENAVTYTVPVGQRRDVPLADGSTLTINSGSTVQVLSLEGSSRELQLLQGEALFTVAHDAGRPFRVRAGHHVIEAVGTAFDVHLRADRSLELLVTDGQVRLLDDGAVAGLISRGEVLRIAADGSMERSTLDAEAMMARMAWRHGMLVFDGEPLSAVLDEFSRYTDSRFVLTDPKVRALRIGGYFPAGDTDFLLETLQGSFGLKSRREPNGVIHILPDH